LASIGWLDVFGAARATEAESGIDGTRDEQRTDKKEATGNHPIHWRIGRRRDDLRLTMLRRELKRSAFEICVSELGEK